LPSASQILTIPSTTISLPRQTTQSPAQIGIGELFEWLIVRYSSLTALTAPSCQRFRQQPIQWDSIPFRGRDSKFLDVRQNFHCLAMAFRHG
jgi:hypothetical protein